MVRQVFLQFATDIAAAEERKDLVKVLAGVDQYVDQVLEGVAESGILGNDPQKPDLPPQLTPPMGEEW